MQSTTMVKKLILVQVMDCSQMFILLYCTWLANTCQ